MNGSAFSDKLQMQTPEFIAPKAPLTIRGAVFLPCKKAEGLNRHRTHPIGSPVGYRVPSTTRGQSTRLPFNTVGQGLVPAATAKRADENRNLNIQLSGYPKTGNPHVALLSNGFSEVNALTPRRYSYIICKSISAQPRYAYMSVTGRTQWK